MRPVGAELPSVRVPPDSLASDPDSGATASSANSVSAGPRSVVPCSSLRSGTASGGSGDCAEADAEVTADRDAGEPAAARDRFGADLAAL
ncbi:hypothetical protein BJF77_07205 [Kocuria sp. CNJ-770]|nr:hypothetical protein BJF77_07205 [Kocuria sp. CNJ-770]